MQSTKRMRLMTIQVTDIPEELFERLSAVARADGVGRAKSDILRYALVQFVRMLDEQQQSPAGAVPDAAKQAAPEPGGTTNPQV